MITSTRNGPETQLKRHSDIGANPGCDKLSTPDLQAPKNRKTGLAKGMVDA
jgi:hypothetical protein